MLHWDIIHNNFFITMATRKVTIGQAHTINQYYHNAVGIHTLPLSTRNLTRGWRYNTSNNTPEDFRPTTISLYSHGDRIQSSLRTRIEPDDQCHIHMGTATYDSSCCGEWCCSLSVKEMVITALMISFIHLGQYGDNSSIMVGEEYEWHLNHLRSICHPHSAIS